MASKGVKKHDTAEVRDIVETTVVPDLDSLIHEKTRLAIVSALATNACLSHKQLREMLKTTDGNVSVHTRKLQLAKYLQCRKTFEGRVPRTEYSLTKVGRRAFERYLENMDALIKASRG